MPHFVALTPAVGSFRVLYVIVALLPLFGSSGLANELTLAWDRNPEPDVTGYRVYFGTESGNYLDSIDVGNVTSATVSNLSPGTTYYFACSAYNSAGLESPESVEIVYSQDAGEQDPDELVVLPLEEGSGVIAGDVSGQGHDGTLQGGAVFEAAAGDGSSSSVLFDGVDDSILLPPVDVAGGGLTLSCWFRADALPASPNDSRLISKATGTAAQDHIFMLGTIRTATGVKLRGRLRTGSTTTTLIASAGELAVGVWYHAAFTYDGERARLFLNATEVGSVALAGAVAQDPSVPVAVGAQPPGAGERFFTGLIDDVRILQRGLSQSELASAVTPRVAPESVADAYETSEDARLSVDAASGVLANDLGGDLGVQEAFLEDDVKHGVLVFNPDGSFIYTPDADFYGQDSFAYRASDGTTLSGPASVTIEVGPINDLPVSFGENYEIVEGTVLTVDPVEGVLANDADPDLDALSAVLVDDVSNGVLALNPDGSFQYTPAGDFSGQDGFTYRASDGVAFSTVTSVKIAVANVNDTPVAADDAYAVKEDMTLTVNAAGGVLGNDSDGDRDALAIEIVEGVTNGTLELAPDGSFVYAPGLNFNGADRFSYRASDGQAVSDAATVEISVEPVNDIPIAAGDIYSAPFEGSLSADYTSGVLANDSDVESDPLVAVLVNDVSNGDLVLNPDGSFVYTPESGFSGQDRFAYLANDGTDHSEPATVLIEVEQSDDPDVLVYLPLDEGGGNVAEDVSGMGNDGKLMNGAIFEPESGDGSRSAVRFDGVDDSIALGPIDALGSGLTLACWFKADRFSGVKNGTCLISKAAGTGRGENVFTFSTVQRRSDIKLRVQVRIDGKTKTLTARSGDLSPGIWYHAAATYDGKVLRLFLDSIEVASMGLSGAIDVDASAPVAVGSFPFGDGSRTFNGLIDDVRILQRALGGDEISSILFGEEAPVAESDSYEALEDQALLVTAADGVLSNDSPGDAGAVEAVLVGDVGNGSLVLNPDGSFQYTAAPDFSGEDSFRYRVRSGATDSEPVTARITVSAVNDAPVAVADEYDVPEGEGLTVLAADGVLGNDADVDLDTLQAMLVSDVSNGSLDFRADGSFTYAPASGFIGEDSFSYQASDGREASEVSTVTLSLVSGSSFSREAGEADGLILHLPADEGSGSTVNDLSGMGNHGTLVNGAGFSSFTGDGSLASLNFDGRDDFVEVGSIDVAGSGLTLACHFNANSFPGRNHDSRMISKAVGTRSEDHVFMLSTIRVDTDVRLRARMRIGSATTTLIATRGNLSPGEWRHAAATYDGVIMRLYLDGVVVGSIEVPGSIAIDPSVPVTIGAQPPGAGGKYFDGLLDDVRIYDRALSDIELEAIGLFVGAQPALAPKSVAKSVHANELLGKSTPSASIYEQSGSETGILTAPEVTWGPNQELLLTYRRKAGGDLVFDYMIDTSDTLDGDWRAIASKEISVTTGPLEERVTVQVDLDGKFPYRAFFRVRAEPKQSAKDVRE